VSLIFLSAIDDLANGDIDFSADTFHCLLVRGYTPDAASHTKRSDVSREVVGSGYLAGGKPVTATVTKDTGLNRVEVAFSSPLWPVSTITADGAVIYKSRGGPASADELVAYVDFGSDFTSSGGPFDVTFTTPLRFQA
jgi:hypothetical protein